MGGGFDRLGVARVALRLGHELLVVGLAALKRWDGVCGRRREVVVVEDAEVEVGLRSVGVDRHGPFVLGLGRFELLEPAKRGAQPEVSLVVVRLELHGLGEGAARVLVATERERDLRKVHLRFEHLRIELDGPLEIAERLDDVPLLDLHQPPSVVDRRIAAIDQLSLPADDLSEVEGSCTPLSLAALVVEQRHLIEGREVVRLDRERAAEVAERFLFLRPTLLTLHDRQVGVARGALGIVTNGAFERLPCLSSVAPFEIEQPDRDARIAHLLVRAKRPSVEVARFALVATTRVGEPDHVERFGERVVPLRFDRGLELGDRRAARAFVPTRGLVGGEERDTLRPVVVGRERDRRPIRGLNGLATRGGRDLLISASATPASEGHDAGETQPAISLHVHHSASASRSSSSPATTSVTGPGRPMLPRT